VNKDALGVAATTLIALLITWPQLGPGTTFPRDHLSRFRPWENTVPGPPYNLRLSDSFLQVFPNRKLVNDIFAGGSFPLWNPYLFAGQPLSADAHSAVFYPLTVLLGAFPPGEAFDLHITIHVLVTALGMYVLARLWGAGALGGVVAAAALCGSATLTVYRFHANLTASAAWLPWILATFELALRRPTRWLAGTALTTGLVLLANFAQWALYALLLVVAYAVWASLFHPDRSIRGVRPLVLAGAALTLGLGIGAVQLLPFAELASFSTRQAPWDMQQFLLRTHTADKLLTLLAPDFFGTPIRGNRWLSGHPVYWGFYPLVLALLAPLYRRDPRSLWLWLATVLSASVAWGAPTLRLLAWLPGLDRLAPDRITYITSLCGALLAGLTLDTVLGTTRRFRWAAVLTAFGLWVILVVAAHHLPTTPADQAAALAASRRTAWFAAVGGFLLVFASNRHRVGVWAARGFVCTVALDVASFSMSYSPRPVPERDLIPMPALLRPLAGRMVPPRIAVLDQTGRTLPSNLLMTLGFAELGGFVSLIQQDSASLMALVNGRSLDAPPPRFPDGRVLIERTLRIEKLGSPLLDLAGVEYAVVADGPVPGGYVLVGQAEGLRLYQNSHAAPRAFVVGRVLRVAGPDEEWAALSVSEFSACRFATIRSEPAAPTQWASSEGCVGEARIVSYRANEVVVEARSTAPGLLVLTDSYYPGWRAQVGASEQPVVRADGAFRGVPLPAGDHRIVFTFRPVSVAIGGAVTAISLLLCSTPLLFRPWRRRTRSAV
jgi:hypothetical protein